MPDGQDQAVRVRARAILVDPASMAVIWMNDAAAAGAWAGSASGTASLAHLVPTAGEPDITTMVAEVAGSGAPRHLRTDLVSTGKGAMALVTSVYRLPDGMVLVISEHAWQAEQRSRRGR